MAYIAPSGRGPECDYVKWQININEWFVET